MQRENRNKKVIPNLIWNLQRKVVSQRQQQRQAWKTLNQVQGDDLVCYNYNSAFTLIELLVVVLIIGILAAVALPQYQKAVEKSRAAEALPLLKSVYQAAQTYYLANGDWPTKFDELAVEIPWTGNVKWRNENTVMTDTRSNDLWSFQIYKEGEGWALSLGRISGKYKGAGFGIGRTGEWTCKERFAEGVTFDGNEGDYCVKIMRCSGTPPASSNVYTWTYHP